MYHAVVPDAHSHHEIGWALDRTLEGHLPIAALRIALRRRSPTAVLGITPTAASSMPPRTTPTS